MNKIENKRKRGVKIFFFVINIYIYININGEEGRDGWGPLYAKLPYGKDFMLGQHCFSYRVGGMIRRGGNNT